MSNEVKQTAENPLGSEKISKLMLSFALPGVVSMVVNALYNIVDQIFIGQGVGYLGNGATNIILPFTVLAIAVGILFGDGGAAYASLQLGYGNKEKASKGIANAVTGIVTAGIILAIIMFVFLKPLCILFGATENILPYAIDYGWIIALGLPGSTISAGFAAMIRADGSPKLAMGGQIAGCIINVVLDALFVMVFHWGVAGAALATIIGQYINAAVFIWYQWHYKSIELRKSYFKPNGSVLKDTMSLGVSSFITQLAVVIVVLIFNRIMVYYGGLSKYGEDIPMTALGVTMKINNILIAIFTGIVTGSQPIIGYNYGAGKTERCKETLLIATVSATVCGIIATIIFQLFPLSIVRIFGTESELYTEFAVKCLKTFLALCALDGFNKAAAVFFQAIGKPIRASVSTLLREIVLLVPVAIIFANILGIEGALWSMPFATFVAVIINIFLLVPELKNCKGGNK